MQLPYFGWRTSRFIPMCPGPGLRRCESDRMAATLLSGNSSQLLDVKPPFSLQSPVAGGIVGRKLIFVYPFPSYVVVHPGKLYPSQHVHDDHELHSPKANTLGSCCIALPKIELYTFVFGEEVRIMGQSSDSFVESSMTRYLLRLFIP